jgi:hypothetical protein
MKERKPVATVPEEPVSTETENRQINTGDPEDTRKAARPEEEVQKSKDPQDEGCGRARAPGGRER